MKTAYIIATPSQSEDISYINVFTTATPNSYFKNKDKNNNGQAKRKEWDICQQDRCLVYIVHR